MILSKQLSSYYFVLIFVCLFAGFQGNLVGQEFNALEISETVVDFYTKNKLEGVSVVILEKRDDGTWEEYGRSVTNKKAFVSSQLYLQKEYMVVFSKKGYIKKKILIDTRMDGTDEDFYEHDNTLFLTNRIVSEQDSFALLDKPIVRVYYSKPRKGFIFDSLYTASIKNEISAIPTDLLGSLITRIEKNTQSQVIDPAEIAKQDEEYQNLLTKVDEEKKRRELEAIAAREKAVQDSLNALAIALRQKAIDDSLAAVAYAQKRAQEIKDSLDLIAMANKNKPPVNTYSITPIKQPTVTPIASRTITPSIKPDVIQDSPLTITKAIVLDMKMQDEIFTEKTGIISEINTARAVKLAIEKEKMDNMHIKYKTGSPFISLLDEIDMYEKGQKNKANNP